MGVWAKHLQNLNTKTQTLFHRNPRHVPQNIRHLNPPSIGSRNRMTTNATWQLAEIPQMITHKKRV
jgi:hypothetical protein